MTHPCKCICLSGIKYADDAALWTLHNTALFDSLTHTPSITETEGRRLTWHDPLADQFLSCSSLLEFELEDCMETEEVRGGHRGEERVSSGPVRVKALQRWSPEPLKLPYSLSCSDHKHICHIQMEKHAEEPRCNWSDMKTCAL